MSYTNRSDPKQNPWYPRHASDRADALIEELDAAQCQQLHDALKKESLSGWFAWLEGQREAIYEYDCLSQPQRKRRLGKRAQIATLKLHHACIFVELWRTRLTTAYLPLPPAHGDLDAPTTQRQLMLATLAAYDDDLMFHDLWPFDFPEEADPFPFQRLDD